MIHMPLLGSIYLAIFATFFGVCVYSECRGHTKPRYLVGDLFSATTFAFLFASHWHSGLRLLSGHIAPVLFFLAVGWEIYDVPREWREVQASPELTPSEKIITPLLGLAVCVPLYVIAGIAAFQR